MKDASDRAATVDRLDRVIQAYADVLRVNYAADYDGRYEELTDTVREYRSWRLTWCSEPHRTWFAGPPDRSAAGTMVAVGV